MCTFWGYELLEQLVQWSHSMEWVRRQGGRVRAAFGVRQTWLSIDRQFIQILTFFLER